MMLDVQDGRSLRSGFVAQAARQPDAPAVVVRAATVTYGELDARARRLAAVLAEGGTRRIERVGVFAYRSETAYAGTLGALYAGAAYVPLNQKFPVERTRAMIRRARLDAIIVDRDSAKQLPQVLDALGTLPPRIVAPDPDVADALAAAGIVALGASDVDAAAPLAVLPPVLGDDVAYLLFTSGTTGEPKGVGVTHGNALHFLDQAAARYPLDATDRCSQTFDQTFDLAVFDLFLTWNAGATLVVPQPIELLAPVRFVQKHALTLWFSVPSAAALAVKKGMLHADAMPTLRFSLFCGEPLPEATARAWQRSASRSVLENLYGPTELTIACFYYRWRDDVDATDNGIVAIGRPLPGLGALVVDDALQPVADGDAGELLVCGPQTTPGYWMDDERTRERFVELSVSPTRRRRFYRTGDRVRRRPDGEYVYIGRTDNQVKVLGFRVELGEIEAVLLRQPGVVQAIAAGWPVEDGSAKGIVAFVTGDADPGALSAASMAVLPDYMVPKQIHVVDDMPLNANGKIDRTALLARLHAEPSGAVR